MSDPAPKALAQPSSTTKSSRKTRVVRRRGPVRNDEDDDIVERAALSGTESDLSLTDGDPESEDETSQAARGPTTDVDATVAPSAAAETPPLTDAATPPHANGTSSNEASHIWSDMVANEQIEGKHDDESDLPVIDFADLALAPVDEILNKAGAAATTTTTAGTVSDAVPNNAAQSAPVAPPKNANVKPKSVAARETYLAKLKDDPAYTPRVGQFWGHDDRLMDKELRGMSEWWKGRWNGRGRGVGGRGGFAGRGGRGGGGRGGFIGAVDGAEAVAGEPKEPTRWDHDGYEELIKQGEGRGRGRRGAGPGAGLNSTQGWFKEKEGRGGRGGGRALGGGGQPVRSNTHNEFQAQLQAQAAAQIASSAASTSASKTSQTQAPTEPTPVAGPSNAAPAAVVAKPTPRAPKPTLDPKVKVKSLLAQASMDRAAASAKSVVAQAKDEVAATQSNGTAPPPTAPAVPAATNPAPASSSVRVNLPRPPTGPKAMRQNHYQNQNQSGGPPGRQQRQPQAPAVSVPPEVSLPAQSLTFGTAEPAIPSPSTSSHPASHPDPASAAQPVPPPPPPPSNPGYSYVALPQGIAMGESGLLYEVATGRPVVLNQPHPQLSQHTPPPTLPLPPPPPPVSAPQPQLVPMYNPRPILHSQTAAVVGARSFIPQHVLNTMPHHHTPDLGGGGGGYAYVAAGSPTPPGGDSSRATPTFFAPPRQGGKLQIRAPGSASTAAGVEDKPLYASSPISPTYQAQHQHQQRVPYDQTSYYSSGSGYYGHNPSSSQQNAGAAPTGYAATSGDDGYYGGAGGAYYPQQGYGGYSVGPPGGDYGYGLAGSGGGGGGMVGDGSYGGSVACPTQDNRDVRQPHQQQQQAMHGFQQGQQVYY